MAVFHFSVLREKVSVVLLQLYYSNTTQLGRIFFLKRRVEFFFITYKSSELINEHCNWFCLDATNCVPIGVFQKNSVIGLIGEYNSAKKHVLYGGKIQGKKLIEQAMTKWNNF